MKMIQSQAFSIAAPDQPVEACPHSALHNEILAVSAGLKPCGRFSATRAKADQVRHLLESNGLTVRYYHPASGEWGYQYLAPKLRSRLLEDRVRVYYSRDPQKLDALMEAQAEVDHEAIGKLLGYPECCIEANRLYSQTRMNDFVRVARVSRSAHWSLNIFLKELEIEQGSPYYLISHFPCHLNCTASKTIAAETFELIRQTRPDFAQRLEEVLKGQVLLYDDTGLPEEEKTGLNGATFTGIDWENFHLYSSWISLNDRPHPHLMYLMRGNSLRKDEEGLSLLDQSGDFQFSFDSSRWTWIPFK